MADELSHRVEPLQACVKVVFSALASRQLASRVCALGLLCIASASVAATDRTALTDPASYDVDQALRLSQAAIGRKLGDYAFLDETGQAVKLSDYRGKPVVISMIYSSCFHTCPATTQNLKRAVKAARAALSGQPFQVLTIGFDVPSDNPQSMAGFRATQAVRAERWAFLSSDKDTIDALTRDLGFAYYASPRGYDHLVQLSIVDDTGVLYQQVYGESFELPWLVEPLKAIVFKDRRGIDQLLSNISNRIRLFCTLYDPASGRYRYDISLFVQMTIGAMSILAGIIFLFREARRAHTAKASKSL